MIDMSPRFKGFIYGVVTSVTFGLIPLFTLPLMREGMLSDSNLFYRFFVSTIALGLVMLIKHESFSISLRDLPIIFVLALFYTASALFLLYGYEVMGAGIATTIHFTYPVFVTLLMLILFREKVSLVTMLAILLAIGGVAKLSLHGTTLRLNPTGVIVVLLSALGYASYIIAVNKSRLKNLHSRKLAFYVFAFTMLVFFIKDIACSGIQPIPDLGSAVNIILLAVAPTVISNITLLLAVRNIGGTLTSILGALEPVTAVCIGALVFSEAFTWSEFIGIVLILTAVVLIILNKGIQSNLTVLLKRIRPRHS